MNTNVDKYLGWISNVIIIYCFHTPIASLLGSVGYRFGLPGLETMANLLEFPAIPFGIGFSIYLIAFPIIAWIVIGESLGKLKRKEKFTFWEKFRFIGALIIIAWIVLVLWSLRQPW